MFDDFVLFSSENPPDSSPAFPAEIIHKVTFATGAVWHYKIFTMPFAFACCTCFTVSYHLKFLSYKFERYLDSYPPFIMKIRSIYRMKERNRNNRVGENSSFRAIFDLSHHRSCGSASGGSINLTSDTPFGVVVQHRDKSKCG